MACGRTFRRITILSRTLLGTKPGARLAARFALGSGYEPAACVARNALMRDRDTRSSWLGVARIHAEFPKPDANAITGVVSNGTGLASNYIVTLSSP